MKEYSVELDFESYNTVVACDNEKQAYDIAVERMIMQKWIPKQCGYDVHEVEE